MEEILISIIIPVYNSEKYLIKCLDSILNQNAFNIEVIAIDDASTDKSPEILDEYKKRKSNVNVIHLKKNGRQGAARNQGIRAAKGRYISFVDSDDWIDKGMYDEVIHKIASYPDLVLISENYRNFSDNTEILSLNLDSEFLKSLHKNKLNNNDIEQLIFKGCGVCLTIFKRSLLIENNVFFPEGVSYEDNYFVPLAVAYAKNLEFINQPFYHYRENINSTCFRNDFTQLDRLKIERLRYSEFKKRGLLDMFYDGYEILTVKIDYLITLGTLCKYFSSDFYHYSSIIKKELYDKFPNFKKNKYYKNLSTIEKIKVKLMEISPWLYKLFYNVDNVLGRKRKR
ncbi:MAG: glycosyltransferase family 2 protein [Erysipelotrichaceae bacterium]